MKTVNLMKILDWTTRIFLSGLLGAILLVCGQRTIPALRPPVVTQVTQVAPKYSATYSGNSSAQEQTFDVRTFGAVGDCVHDDTAAIQAANAAASNIPGGGGTVYFPAPTSCYKVTSETLVEYRAHWTGATGTVNQTIIRAFTPMRSILAVRSTYGYPQTEGAGAYKSWYEHLTFDANNTATNAIYQDGAAYSIFEDVRTINAPFSGFREALIELPATLSSVTCAGTCTAGTMTVSQLDTGFIGYQNAQNPAGTYPVWLKITTGGSLGTAQFEASTDSGVTYGTVAQTLFAKTNIANDNGFSYIWSLSGFQVQAQAGIYTLGDIYKLTYTTTNGDTPFPPTANWNIKYEDGAFLHDGTVYATSGAISHFESCTVTSTSGTVTQTAGSPFIIGVGTSFTSMVGAGWSRQSLWTSQSDIGHNFYQVGVLSDTVLFVTNGTLPTTTASGLDFAIGSGAGLYNDGLNEISEQYLVDNKFDFVSTGFSTADFRGADMAHNEFTNVCFYGSSFGGPSNIGTQITVNNYIRGDNHNSQCRLGYYLAPGSTGSINELKKFATFAGSGAGWIYRQLGVEHPLGASSTVSNLPIYTLQLKQAQPFTFTTGAETIPLPSLTDPGLSNTGSFIEIQSSSEMTLTGTPVLAPAGSDGIIVYLMNIGSYPITIQAHSWAASGIYTTGQYVTLTMASFMPLISRQNQWIQTGNVMSLYANSVGDQSGPCNKTIMTTDSTPVTILNAYVLASSFLNHGSMLKFDIKAQARGGLDVAFWNDCAVFDDGAANRLGYKCSTYVASPGNAASWTMNTTNSVPFENVTIAGDSSGNPVYWSIDCAQKSPSASYP
jgi:hypothetical protein